MSSTVTRLPAHEAEAIAKRFIRRIEDACLQVEIAGSLRRLLPDVGDIEIVAVPRVESVPSLDMFGEVTQVGEVDFLGVHLAALLDSGLIQKRPRSDGKTFWGPKAKYLTFDGTPIDLFTPSAERWGLILAIRTGPWQFSNALVTPRSQKTREGRRGLLPDHLRVQDGWLTERMSGRRIETPEERDVFELLKLRWIEPEHRL